MTIGAGSTVEDARTSPWLTVLKKMIIVLAPFGVVQLWRSTFPNSFPDWALVMPDAAIPNLAEPVNRFVDFLKEDEIFGLFNFRELTRSLSGLLDYPIDFAEGLLRTGEGSLGVGPIPWPMLVSLGGVLGWYLGGRRLALLAVGSILYFAVVGVWEDAMETLAVLAVASPIAVILGFSLGLFAVRKRWFEKVLVPFLNVLQTFPHFAYLIPVVVFIGLFGRAGVIATIIFAFPPMARLTIVGMQGIPPDVIEAGKMSGSSSLQLLRKVELPSARRALMVGVNQVVMSSLAMVVIASLIGTSGLGLSLRQRLRQLDIGEAFQIGIAVVLMAIALDRLSQAWAEREPQYREGLPFVQRYKHLLVALVLVIATFAASRIFESMHVFPDEWQFSFADQVDQFVRWMSTSLPVESTKNWLLFNLLLPMRDAFRATPWILGVAIVASIGWALRGPRLALSAATFPLLIALTGYWFEAMETTYLVVAAVGICTTIGVPLGVWASKSARRISAMQVVLDAFQTMPPFVYFLPVIMLFRISPAAVLTSMIIYPMVPAVRYTMLGLRGVPVDKVEAAKTSGCTSWQVLWKVKMPLAMPEILLGLNQTILYAIFMAILGTLIGGVGGLAAPLKVALGGADMGNGMVVGLTVACIGLTADKLITTWSAERKAQLGLP
ncbi:MAG: glycine betaine/proline transport system permease protein [Verrucomicrobiales bacterium]|jgi:glycine betaine/proline transport system permease protein